MATGDKKISALPALTGADSATNDVFVIVDTSEAETKGMTRAEVANALSGENFPTITVDTDTLVVDEINGRVGIGTASPDTRLHIKAIVDSTLGALKIESLDGTSYFTIDANNAGNLRFYRNGVPVARFDPNGAFLHGTSIAGAAGAGDIVVNGGIFLGGSAAANKLEDYEEGTWTASLSAVTSGTITENASFVTLSYTKNGREVHIYGNIVVSSVSSPLGGLRMTGLPFACAGLSQNSERSGFAIYPTTLGSAVTALLGLVIAGETQVRIANFDGTDSVDDAANKVVAGTSMTFDFSYQTA